MPSAPVRESVEALREGEDRRRNGRRVESVEAVDDPLLVARILLALGLYGRAPARAPPRTGSGLFDDVGQCTYEEDD